MEHRIILQIEQRGPAYSYSARDTAAVLAGALRIDPLEATARFRAAEAAGPRREVNGDPAPASYPAVAAAQAAGSVSPRQAAVIVRCVETLPEAMQAEHGARVETELVGHAKQVAPAQLATLGIRHHTHLDPDGKYADAAHRDKHRDFTLHTRPGRLQPGRR